MGINFPASPTLNQKHPQPPVDGIPVYTWDGEKWTTVGGSIAAYAPPADAVPLMNAGSGLVGTSTDYAREDHVHPSDASLMAYSGMQINGGMEVSQEFGATVSTGWLNYYGYPIDGWLFAAFQATAGTTAFRGGQIASLLPGIPNSLQLQATGAANFAAATDRALIFQHIEGYRWARLGFGYANAQSVSVGFWIYASATGTFCVSIGSRGTIGRIYIREVTVNAASTWEYKTLTFPPDVTGPANWLTTNGIGCSLQFCFGGGATTKSGTANAWADWTPTYYSTANQSNFFAADNREVYLTGVTVLPGTQAPTAAQSPNIMRAFDQELVTCRRYYQKVSGSIQWTAYSATEMAMYSIQLVPPMRANPTAAYTSTVALQLNVNALLLNYSNQNSLSVQVQSVATGDTYDIGRIFTADARL